MPGCRLVQANIETGGDVMALRPDRKYRFDRLRCRRCGHIGALQFRGFQPRHGGVMISAKCTKARGGCGGLTHVEEEKALA